MYILYQLYFVLYLEEKEEEEAAAGGGGGGRRRREEEEEEEEEEQQHVYLISIIFTDKQAILLFLVPCLVHKISKEVYKE
jgi:hypothetical protein